LTISWLLVVVVVRLLKVEVVEVVDIELEQGYR
jgi:hypothetical protein